jgi:hypothetical protein
MRGSFECMIKAGEEIRELNHIMNVNDGRDNSNDEVNLNLFALNEEIGFYGIIKAKLEAKGKIQVRGREMELKRFIELHTDKKDEVISKEAMKLLDGTVNEEVDWPGESDASTDKESDVELAETNELFVVEDEKQRDETKIMFCDPESATMLPRSRCRQQNVVIAGSDSEEESWTWHFLFCKEVPSGSS